MRLPSLNRRRFLTTSLTAVSSARLGMRLGTPEEVALVPESYTGRFLAEMLPQPAPVRRAAR